MRPALKGPRAARRVEARKIPGLTAEVIETLARERGVPFEEVMRYAAGGAERKVAERLGTVPELISITALWKWGRSLTAERDALAKSRTAGDPKVLGHITRELARKLDKDLRTLRVEALRKIAPGIEPALAVVDEASQADAVAVASLLRTISELVVVACYDLWDQGPAARVADVVAAAATERAEPLSDAAAFKLIAGEIRGRAEAHDPRIPKLWSR